MDTISIQIDDDPREEKNRSSPVEGLQNIQIDGLDEVVQIENMLLEEQAKALTLLLIEFKELFTRKPSDMHGIRWDVT